MINNKKIPIIAVVGPTASGKTALGIELAKYTNGEVVSCDSMQIYKNLDIATAKPTQSEMDGIPHHMIDVAEPCEVFSVQRFCAMAHEVIEDIYLRGKTPILVGGTGLYIDNTVMNTSFLAPARDERLTDELLEFSKKNGNDALYEILLKEDFSAAQKIHPNDTKRVIRAIETVRTTGKTRSDINKESREAQSKYDCLWLGINIERPYLYERINMRVDKMLKDGLLEETKKHVYPLKNTDSTSISAIGYREALAYLDGLCTYGEMVNLLKRNTRRYAKRQQTWFSANKNINWLNFNLAFYEAKQLIEKRNLK